MSEIADGHEVYLDGLQRPRVRGDCLPCPTCQTWRDEGTHDIAPDRLACGHTPDEAIFHSRPCVRVACKFNLYADPSPRGTPNLKLNRPDLEPWQMPPEGSCALDVCDAGGATLEGVGALINVTREDVRQIELKAYAKPGVREALEAWADHEPVAHEGALSEIARDGGAAAGLDEDEDAIPAGDTADARFRALMVKTYALAIRSRDTHMHLQSAARVKDAEIGRWSNLVVAHLRAGDSLRSSLAIANEAELDDKGKPLDQDVDPLDLYAPDEDAERLLRGASLYMTPEHRLMAPPKSVEHMIPSERARVEFAEEIAEVPAEDEAHDLLDAPHLDVAPYGKFAGEFVRPKRSHKASRRRSAPVEDPMESAELVNKCIETIRREGPISRAHLVAIVGETDYTLRSVLEQARKDGKLEVSGGRSTCRWHLPGQPPDGFSPRVQVEPKATRKRSALVRLPRKAKGKIASKITVKGPSAAVAAVAATPREVVLRIELPAVVGDLARDVGIVADALEQQAKAARLVADTLGRVA